MTMIKTAATMMAATLMATAAMAQQPKVVDLEPLFRAGVMVSSTFEDNPVAATIAPLKVELTVAETKTLAPREKAIVDAYSDALLKLKLAAISYSSHVDINLIGTNKSPTAQAQAEKASKFRNEAEIKAAVAKLEAAQTLYTTPPEKPIAASAKPKAKK